MTSTASTSSAGSPRGRVPDFFMVGAPKTGTTSLYKMLRRHPQIYMPDMKEPRFLASEMRPRAKYAKRAREAGFPTTLEAYLALFDDAAPDQRAGEATTLYLWSRTAANNIADLQPNARIICGLREPASFLRSLHMQLLQATIETEKDFGRAISLEAARKRGKRIPRTSPIPQLLLYSDHVRYVEQLQRYHARFSTEQVLVLIYDDFRRDNEGTLRKVERFLDVDDTHPLKIKKVNPTVRLRSRRLNKLVRTVAWGDGPLPRAAKTLTPAQLRRGSALAIRQRILFGEPRPLDESLMVELRHRFKPEVVSLSDYLGRDLVSLWGYDKL